MILSLEDLLSAPPGRRFRSASLCKHIAYLKREGVTRNGADARMFDATSDAADTRAFTERCGEGGITSGSRCRPRNTGEMVDLRAFTRELMTDAERPRNESRLGRGRSLEHRQPPYPSARPPPSRRWSGSRHQPRLHQQGLSGPGGGTGYAGAGTTQPSRKSAPTSRARSGRNAGQVSTDRSATSRMKAEESSTNDRPSPARTPSYAG